MSAKAKSIATAGIKTKKNISDGIKIKNLYRFECIGKNGKQKWVEECYNMIVNTGLDDILEQYYRGSAYTAAHYVGLTDGTPTPAAADTMASHTGWAEVETYSESVRQTLTMAAASSQSITNSASQASFSINGSATAGGAFVSTNNTKGGTTGTLISVVAFTSGDRSLQSGDTLNVTVTTSLADS